MKPKPKPNGTPMPEAVPEFPEIVEFKSSRTIIYQQRHRGKLRFEVRHHDAEGFSSGPRSMATRPPRSTPTRSSANCVKGRKETMVPAEIGHRAVTMCQIGHIAIETGAKLKWNPETDRFTNNANANQLHILPQRALWKV